MRFVYNLIAYLLFLPYAAYWLVRALSNRTYRPKIGQRLGFSYPNLQQSIWVHAVSVGEVVAAEPLVRALVQRYPDYRVLVTTVTPTGAARVRSSFGDSVVHSYIPFEAPFAVSRFFESVNPKLALILETEIWPNLYHGCGKRRIPLVLVSARISPRSVNSYRKLLPLFRETLSHGIVIAAQSRADSERFLSLGASPERTRVTGNIKFDIELPGDIEAKGRELRQDVFGRRPVWIAASTHEQEELKVLSAHRKLLQLYPDLLLVLVPRHPERFASVADLTTKMRLEYVARTERIPCSTNTNVYLGDTMGELLMMYAASDIAFVGGSLVPIGGHNLLEPSALGLPIISGPHMFNAQEIADMFVDQGACRVVTNDEELADVVAELLTDEATAKSLGDSAKAIVAANRGALVQLLDVIEPLVASDSIH